jgi:hypothetical protein
MWSGLPHGTREVAVLVDDPDAPHGTFVHWVVWGIDPTAGKLVTPLPAGIREGRNDFGHRGWGGPCPPKGDKPHHYRFTVLALSAHLPLQSGASPASMGKQANSILLATGRLTGLFGR